MENVYTDRLRCDRALVDRMRAFFRERIGGRRAIVVGSAPNPIFPSIDDDYMICVNGSAYSLDKYCRRPADATFLNAAIFRDENAYTQATRNVLSGKDIGDVILNAPDANASLAMLCNWSVKHGSVFPVTKYDKRVVLSTLLGCDRFGFYAHSANVSNGVFMAAFALWAGAKAVVLVGFSFSNAHEYGQGAVLSQRAHVEDDRRFLTLAKAAGLPIEATAPERLAGP